MADLKRKKRSLPERGRNVGSLDILAAIREQTRQDPNENPAIRDDAERAVTMIKSVKNRFSMTHGFIACVAIAGFATSAAAQNSTVLTGNTNDLRPLYADAGDIAEGKRLADSSCAGCHGANGISASPGVPNLAGQRPAYLYLELRAYQSLSYTHLRAHETVLDLVCRLLLEKK